MSPPGESGARAPRGSDQKGRRFLIRLLSLYPPFLGAGIRVRRTPSDPPGFEVSMKLHFWNRNYFGTHFGGSLYSMCDPFFVLVLASELGSSYVVWDKAATIRFKKPGRGTVRARFEIPRARVEEIRAAADAGERVAPTFVAEVRDEAGEVVAEVEKMLSVRRRSFESAGDRPEPRHPHG